MTLKAVIQSSLTIAAAFVCSTGSAQNAPPIKPGLWQVTPQGADGKPQPALDERLKNLSPEVRKQIEASMKARGVDASGGTMKICLNKESLDSGEWQGRRGSCKTEIKSRTSSSWAWHSICSDPVSETEGVATFTNAENYVVKTSTSINIRGQMRNSQNTLSAKWLGSNCGDLKPISPPPTK